MGIKVFIIHFFIGGLLLCGIMYLGSIGKGYWAAFLAVMPVWTIVPLYTIYYQSGMEAALDYMQGLIFLTVPWLLYASCIVWFAPYIGLLMSSIIGFTSFIIFAFIINWLRKI